MPGTLTALTMRPSANGNQTFARSAPLYIDARDLAASTNETHTVPAGADYVIFSADGDFYAKPNGAAAVPADGPGRAEDPFAGMEVSRNAPCPCGSGNKYKHCHGAA